MGFEGLDIEPVVKTAITQTAQEDELFDMEKFEKTQWKEENMLMISCGNGGGNMLKHHILTNKCSGVKNYITDTDFIALKSKMIDGAKVVLFGENECKGKGAGTHPEKGEKAALESEQIIRKMVKDAGLVFVIAGEGGGTGTGCSPVVAKIAKEEGAIVVGIVTKPFGFEGKVVESKAIEGIRKLRENVNAILVVDNEKVLSIGDPNIPWMAQFRKIDDFVDGILSGFINVTRDNSTLKLDFNDIRNTFEKCEGAMFIGAGEAEYTPMSADNKGWDGAKKAMMEAVENAISSPLIGGINLKNAKGVIALYSTGEDVSLEAIYSAQDRIKEATGNYDGTNIILGANASPEMNGKIKVFYILAGLEDEETVQENIIAIQQRPINFDKGEKIKMFEEPTVAPEIIDIERPKTPILHENNEKADDTPQIIVPISEDAKTSNHVTKSIYKPSHNIGEDKKRQDPPSIYRKDEVAGFLRTQCQ